MLQAGIKGRLELTVTKEKCAGALGSGELDVFATPAMIALIEETAWRSVVSELRPGEGTVGTALNVRHLAATPIGLQIVCETELTLVDRRRLVFDVKVYDPFGLVGEGTHERFVIQYEKFMKKANEKLDARGEASSAEGRG
jgi:predicted thioesterase